MGGWREGAALAPRWAGVFFSRAEKNQKAGGASKSGRSGLMAGAGRDVGTRYAQTSAALIAPPRPPSMLFSNAPCHPDGGADGGADGCADGAAWGRREETR